MITNEYGTKSTMSRYYDIGIVTKDIEAECFLVSKSRTVLRHTKRLVGLARLGSGR